MGNASCFIRDWVVALLLLLTVATAAAGYDMWRMLAEWTAEKTRTDLR